MSDTVYMLKDETDKSRIGHSATVNYPHKEYEGELVTVVNEYDTDYEWYYRVRIDTLGKYEVFSESQLDFYESETTD